MKNQLFSNFDLNYIDNINNYNINIINIIIEYINMFLLLFIYQYFINI